MLNCQFSTNNYLSRVRVNFYFSAEQQSRVKKLAAKTEEKWIRELDELHTKENRGRLDFLHGKIIGLVFACYFRFVIQIYSKGAFFQNLNIS